MWTTNKYTVDNQTIVRVKEGKISSESKSYAKIKRIIPTKIFSFMKLTLQTKTKKVIHIYTPLIVITTV